jgi:hypothetical protein
MMLLKNQGSSRVEEQHVPKLLTMRRMHICHGSHAFIDQTGSAAES